MRFLPIHLSRAAAVIATTGVLACSSVKEASEPALLSDASIRVVTAREAGTGRGPIGMSDRFTTDGQVFAFISVVWPVGHTAWGSQTFESRWYSGDRLVVKREATFEMATSPFNFVSSVFPVNLGAGTARYEVHAAGKKLAEKTFDVTEPGAPLGVGAPPARSRPVDLRLERSLSRFA